MTKGLADKVAVNLAMSSTFMENKIGNNLNSTCV